ncbi:MAG: eukaryotic-like serine/threonine-protein kinase [Solirubrobacterales bacterium]|jgi:serine/threonine-protein kinase|nr:eukaryotic-like serine/threonine-protein kinase [Solirubrobacterales bacterium]
MLLATDTMVDGRYKLVRRLGSGGMADVWCAEDEHLGRTVALKILHERFAQDREFVERFRREASSAAGLQHPNVVGVFDRGEFEGTYYIAMELLEGESLKQRIARGLSIPEALAIIRQILSAARFAHERGIIHRDFKPQNVIISREGKATVTDFGIAHAGASEITQTGSVMGTAHYLSPEQAQGLPVTAASDLYSTGIILYECLTGHVPFEAESSVAVALKQVSEMPRRPSALNPEVSPALDAVVMRALAKDPARRFADADAFRLALDQAEANPGEPAAGDTASFALPVPAAAAKAPPAGPPPGWVEDRRRRHRRRWLIFGVLGLLLSALAAFALTRPQMVPVPNVYGRQVAEATQILEAKGFDVSVQMVQRDAPVDTVIETDPPALTKVKKGSTVTLSVSAGPGLALVPKVDGLNERPALKALMKAGFEVKSVERFSRTIPAGEAIGTSPGPGVKVSRGSVVTLFVSKGTDQIAVPDVVGLTRGSALAELRDAGFAPAIDERDDPAPAGEVISQSPIGGALADKRSSVTIVVSTGRFAIKNVVGLGEARAVKTLRNQGLSVRTEHQATSNASEDGRVLDQTPSGGSTARRGEIVTITVGNYSPTVLTPGP